MNAQVSSSKPIDINQPNAPLKLTIPIIGKAGASFDTSTGKYKICPGWALYICASITIVLFDSAVIGIDDNNVAITDEYGNITNVINSNDVDTEALQSKIASGKCDFESASATSTSIDGY